MTEKHPGGRPRTTSLPPEQMIELGEEMVGWVYENQPIHLSHWYCLVKKFTYNQWKKFIEKEEFRPYYEEALTIIGIKYLNGTIDNSIAQRFLRVYFKDLKEEENELVVYKAEAMAKANASHPTQQPVINVTNYMPDDKSNKPAS